MSTAVTAAPAPGRTVARLLGVDAARGLALLAMMVTHLVPQFGTDGGAEPAFAVADGRASALFALVAGMSLALGDGGAAGGSRPYGVLLARIAVRAVLVGVLGLLLAWAQPPILVILAYYAVMFALVAPLLRLPPAVLGVLALVWAVTGPVLSHALRSRWALPDSFQQPTLDRLVAEPGSVLTQLLVTGTYPAGTWLAYALAGAALGRVAWTRGRAAAAAAAGLALALAAHGLSALLLRRPGAAVPAASVDAEQRHYGSTPTDTWWWLAIDTPHSGTPLDLLATIGSAVLVVGVMLVLLGSRLSPGLAWLAATGSMTLTLYTAHVLAAAAGWPPGEGPWTTWAVHAGLAVAVAVLWRWWFRRGPLEAGVAAAVAAVTPAGARRHERAPSPPAA